MVNAINMQLYKILLLTITYFGDIIAITTVNNNKKQQTTTQSANLGYKILVGNERRRILEQQKIIEIELLAAKIRLESILSMGSCGSGHVGGVLSAADVVAVLYGDVVHYDSTDPLMEDRDRVILSKGHCGPVLYAALALKGFFPIELLSTLNQNNTTLPSHCSMHDTPGIDMSTGSLGQGASLAAGLALGMKLKNIRRFVYLILGDGECDEGQVWEMAMFAAQQKLDHLVAFVDLNHQQLDGYTDDICALGDIRRKFEDFGWHALQVDGHDPAAIYDAIQKAKEVTGIPSVIVLDTVKGKGWSVTEGKGNVHHIPVTRVQMEAAKLELGGRIGALQAKLQEGGI